MIKKSTIWLIQLAIVAVSFLMVANVGAISLSATSEKDKLPGVVEVEFNVEVDGKPITFRVTIDKEARAEVESIAEDSDVVVDDDNTVKIDGETLIESSVTDFSVTDLYDPQEDDVPAVDFDDSDLEGEDVCSQFFFEAQPLISELREKELEKGFLLA